MTNLRNFFNNVSGNNRIFTSEDIGEMSKEEFANSEKAIRHQWDSVGIPSNGELATSDDVVYVHAYTRGDGTEVRAHYRSKGGGRLGIGTVTGGAASMGNSITGVNTTNSIPYDVFSDGVYNVDLNILDDQGNLNNPDLSIYDVSSAFPVSVEYNVEYTLPNQDTNVGRNDFSATNNKLPIEYNKLQALSNSQFSLSQEDNSSLYESLLKGTLPELRDWNFNREFQNEFNEAVKTKDVLDGGINTIGYRFKTGRNFWNLASQGIDRNKDYIDKNGSLYNKVSDLPFEYQNWAKNKVNSQYGINDCRGIVFDENSEVSQTIAHSNELNGYISRNFSDLMAGKVIKDDSISFDINKDSDLWSGFGKADIIEAKVKDGYLEVIIGDTYDFNKNSKNKLVQKGRQVQDAGLLEPYYTITKVKIKL